MHMILKGEDKARIDILNKLVLLNGEKKENVSCYEMQYWLLVAD